MAAIARTIGAAFCLDNHFSEAGSWPARPNAALQVVGTVVGTVFLRNTARPNAALCKVRIQYFTEILLVVFWKAMHVLNPTTLHNVIK